MEDTARRKRLLGLALALALLAAGVAVVAGVALMGPPPEEPGGAIGEALPVDEREDILAAARSYLQKEEPGKAEAILRTAVEQAPRDQDLRTLYAETLLQRDKQEEALTHYEHAIAIGPDNAELRFAAGTLASVVGDTQRAIEHYWQARQMAPQNPKHPFYLAQVQRKAGQIEEAKASLLHAGKLDPSIGGVWGTLAAIALDENKLSLAQNYIERAREVEPDNTGWRIIQAKALRRDNEPEAALRILGALPDAKRLENRAVVEEMALCYGLLQRPRDAAKLYADAADRQPENADLLYGAAEWYNRLGEQDIALIYARRAARQGHEGGAALAAQLEG